MKLITNVKSGISNTSAYRGGQILKAYFTIGDIRVTPSKITHTIDFGVPIPLIRIFFVLYTTIIKHQSYLGWLKRKYVSNFGVLDPIISK